MQRIIFLFSTLLFSFFAVCQPTIKGRVVNESTGLPIPNCNVFISSTSKGTVSDNAGNFELNNVPGGKHELVISCVGYETNVFPFSEEQLPLRLKIELGIKIKELENVTVESSVEEGWDKWGKLFTNDFIGTTENAVHCTITNKKSIHFRFYKKSNRLVAWSDEPVIVENKALGYVISYQLENFEADFSSHVVSFVGYTLFGEMDGDKKKWHKNRMKAYEGSIMHFLRSLYANQLEQQGFEVRRMVRLPNLEKQRVQNIYKEAYRLNTGTPGPPDSQAYYERVFRQQDYKDIYGNDLLIADSLLTTEGEYKLLHFDDYLYITYRNALEEQGYVEREYPVRKRTFQRSYVTLLNDKVITFDVNGNYYDPQDFFASGYWGWGEKIARMLPLEFEPGE